MVSRDRLKTMEDEHDRLMILRREQKISLMVTEEKLKVLTKGIQELRSMIKNSNSS